MVSSDFQKKKNNKRLGGLVASRIITIDSTMKMKTKFFVKLKQAGQMDILSKKLVRGKMVLVELFKISARGATMLISSVFSRTRRESPSMFVVQPLE